MSNTKVFYIDEINEILSEIQENIITELCASLQESVLDSEKIKLFACERNLLTKLNHIFNSK